MSLRLFAVTLLGVSVFPVMVVPSNVHEKMTPAEIFNTFGTTADAVPDYEVFPVSFARSRRDDDANEELKLTLELEGKEFNLKLKPSKGQLASKFTPVWSAISDEKAYNKIRYEPLPNAMTDIGEFQMYHDIYNDAAAVVYSDPDDGTVLEGVVTPFYAIKSLPKRAMSEVQKLGDHAVKTPLNKRSIDDLNADDEMNYVAVYKIPAAPKYVKRSVPMEVDAHRSKRRGGRNPTRTEKLPDTVYPEMLIVLDHNAVRNRTITQTLRFMLAFWNGADMVYSKLSKPRVRLNIAGIIISADDEATPYITPNTSKKVLKEAGNVLRQTGQYFFKEQGRFPFQHFDMVIVLTTIDLCWSSKEPCDQLLGVARSNAACTSIDDMEHSGMFHGVGFIHYNWDFGGVDTATHEAAHLFGVRHDVGDGDLKTNDCDMEEGYTMAEAGHFRNESFTWSICSVSDFRTYFSKKESQCLDDPPLWMKQHDEVLPGRWLTFDGQCRNEGFEKTCKVPKIPVCMVKGCQAEGSEECVITEWTPLPGSKCGDDMICNTKSTCVKD